MKGIVLAGGRGTRLQPFTFTRPKQLIPVANKPILQYALEDLKAAGITEIGVILGNKGREEIQSYFGDGSSFGVDITYVVQGNALGLAHAVGCARDFVDGDPFVVYLGDVFIDGGITRFVEKFDPSRYDAAVGLQEVDEPSRYGVARVDCGEVRQLVEKPDDPTSRTALVGVYAFTPAIFHEIERLQPSWRGELELTEAIQRLIDGDGRVQSHVVGDRWIDVGTPKDVLRSNRIGIAHIETGVAGTIEADASITGPVELGKGSYVERGATIRGPVSIGENSHVKSGTHLGPYTSIGDGCVLENASVESSVLLDEVTVRADVHLSDAIVGYEVDISDYQNRDPDGVDFVLGHKSSVKL